MYVKVHSGATRLQNGWYAVLRYRSEDRRSGALVGVDYKPWPSKGAAEKVARVAAKRAKQRMRGSLRPT
ncbi:hypothetical protein FHR55_000675 [Xanthomonas arboricola]